MKRIRVQIEEYEATESLTGEALHTVRLNLPLGALEEIVKVAQRWDKNLQECMLSRLLEDLERLERDG